MITLPKTVVKRKKRVGRGRGSGKGGHTVGRGQKGQKSRGSVGVMFEGYKVRKSLFKRLPLQRGKGKFKSSGKPLAVNLSLLNLLPEGSKVDSELLVKHGVVRKNAVGYGIKILGDGDITKKLKIALPISKSAARKVEKAGGEILSEKKG